MDFGLSSDQTLLQESLAKALAAHAPLARVRRYAEDPDDRAEDVCAALADLGLPGLVTAEAAGGVGLGFLEAALAAETLGAHVAPVPFAATNVLVPLALAEAGSEAQRARWLPALAAGTVTAGLAVSEHTGAREDAAVHVRDGRLHGRALFVLDFAAEIHLVADATGGLHLVDAAAPGLDRTSLVTIDRTRRVGELRFTGVPADPLPGSLDGAALGRLIDRGRVLLAADTLGAAQHMLDAAVAYAGERKQFGRAIGSFQAVKHLCAEMAAALEPCRALVWYAAHALDTAADDAHLTACHAKAHVAEVGKFIAKTATEVHGGVGFTDLLGLHYWFKRIGLNRQLLGGPERCRAEAAQAHGFG
ncbi:MAG: acyl-CoA dehydrogenase family protein [Gammaproteobacteria bacterium]